MAFCRLRFSLFVLFVVFLSPKPTVFATLEADVCAASTDSPFSLGSAGAAASVRIPVLAAIRRPGTDGFGCSRLAEDAWPSVKALEWAFDLLNKDSGTEAGLAINDSYIPGVKFVLSVHDTCGRRQVTDSLLDSIFPDLVSTSASCSANRTLVPGVIGPAYTASAMSLAPLLNDFGIPMVSYSASGPSLSDRSAYPNFFRTIPSDTAQFDAIGAVLRQYNWTHIGILYTTDAYGTAGQSALVSLSSSIGVCVAQASAISVSPTATEVSSALGRLRDSGVRAVVAIASLADFSILFNDPASSAFQWVMSDSFGNPPALLGVKNARGLTSVSLGYRPEDVFERFYLNELKRITDSSDPNADVAFKQWYMQANNCTLSGMTNYASPGAPACPAFSMTAAIAQYQQNRLVEPAIDAAYVYARALRQLWQTKCAGVRGVCAALRGATYAELRAAVAATDFSYTVGERISRYATASSEPERRVKRLRFTSSGDPYETNYFVHNLRQNSTAFTYVRVGVRLSGSFAEWLPGSVNVFDQARDVVIATPQFSCPTVPCSGCLAAAPDFKYAHTPGDVYLLGIFSVHAPGASPRSCGAVSLEGSSELDAFLYSVSQANSLVNASTLIGAVAIDDCGSSVLAQDLVDSLISGARTIPGLDPSRIIGVVGAGGPVSTDGVAHLLASLQRSQISYRPTALLSSPYLYQTVASAAAEADALLSTLESLSVNYVQLVHCPDAANREVARLFMAGARTRRICVSASYELGTNGTHAQVMAQVRTRTAAATVVALVTASDAALLLTQVTAPFQMVGGAHWGSSQSALATASPSQSQGIITLGEPRPASATPYEAWARRTRGLANETAANPWYSEWFESLNSCSLSAANMRGYATLCAATDSHILTASTKYTESAYTGAVQRASAVYALAASSRLRRVCTGSGVCTAFWFAGNGTGTGLQADLITQFGANSFTDPVTRSAFSFASRSVPNFGLTLYNVRNASSSGPAYQATGATVPSFNLNTGLLQLAYGAAALTSSCADVSRCSECAPYFTGTPSYLYLPGDLLIGVLVNVRAPGTTGGACGAVKTGEGFVYTEAVRWTLNYINNGNKSDVRLGGSVKLGALILDVCGSSSVAISLVTSITQGTLLLADRSTGANIDASRIRSWVSYGDSVTTALTPVLRNLGGVPLVSPSASSDDLTALGVFRTVPASLSQVPAILEVIKRFGWKCVQLVYSNDDYGSRLATEFRVHALRNGICVPRCLQVTTDGSVASILTSIIGDISKTRVVVVLSDNAADLVQLTSANHGLVFVASNFWGEMTRDSILSGLGPGSNNSWVVQVNSPDVAGVTAHLSGLSAASSSDNPWLVPFYEALYNCSTSGSLAYSARCNNSWPITASTSFHAGLFTMTTTNALFSIGRAYADMLATLCTSSYTTVCPAFWSNAGLNGQLADKLAAVSFLALGGSRYEYRGTRDGNMGWLMLNRVGSAYLPVARYMFDIFAQLPAFDSRSSVYSSVPAACADCTNCPKSLDRTEKFLYVPGKLLIGGLFDVHNSGSVPFSCGTVNGQNGFLLTEVFKYAIESIPRSPIFAGKLPGVTIGGVVFDTCSSTVRTDSLVANFHSGTIVLRDSSLNRIDPETVMAYVAASTSEAADQLSKVTDVIQAPVISYAATMSSLGNRQLYPYFSRTVPSDDKAAFAIVDFLKRYGLTNVQFVLSPGAYGTSGLQSVQRAIVNEGICISNTLQVNRTGLTSVNADQIASELLKRPQSTVVVTFLQSGDLAELLGAVSRNNLTADRFLFIGTTYWGNSKSVLSKVTNGRYPRAITFGFETADLTDFERSYLLPKNPTTYSSVNPWFSEFYEYLFQCTLASSSPYYSRTCTSSTQSLTDSSNYSQDSLALYVVNAVYSAALGIHNALLRICGPTYNGICSDFYGSGEKRQWVLSGIRSAAFVDATNLNFTMSAAGESNRGYHIYDLRTSSTAGPNYFSVGSYNDTALLKLRSDFSLTWSSNCGLAGACENVCPNLGRNLSVYMQANSSTMDLNLVQFLSVHQSQSASVCGPMDLQSGFNNLLAFHYALDLINNNSDAAVAGFKFGGLSIDVCRSEARAATFAFSYASGTGICGYAGFSDLVGPLTAVAYMADGATVSARLATTVPDATVISPDATAISLSSRTLYPRFLRVVPPDSVQIDALLDVASYYTWSVVSLIYDTTPSGLAGKAAFEAATARRNGSRTVCVKYIGAGAAGSAISLAEAKTALQSASRTAYVNALIVYLPEDDLRTLLTAVRELGLQGRFVLLGLDSWADKMSVVQGLETAALGAVTLRQTYFTVPDLDRWVAEIGLAPARRKGIPVDWLEEFWQHTLKCRLTGSSVIQVQYAAVCDPSGSLPAGTLTQNGGTYSTILSAFIAAKGVADFQRAECGTLATDVCLYRMSAATRLATIYRYISSAQWQVLQGRLGNNSLLFRFTTDGYGDRGYDVLNFVRSGPGFAYNTIGYWSSRYVPLVGQSLATYGPDGSQLAATPSSACPAGVDCGCPGDSGDPLGLLPRPDVWDRARTPWGAVLLALTTLGALVTLIAIGFLAQTFPRKLQGTAGTNYLGFACLVGLLLVFAINIAFIAHATPVVCTIRRFGLSLAYCVIYASLLVRSVVNWTIHRAAAAPGEGPSFAGLSHPVSLLGLAVCLCLVSAMLGAEWLILQRPDVTDLVAYEGVAWSRCSPTGFYDEGLALSCLYPAGLLLAAIVYSLLSWDANLADSRQVALGLLFCAGAQLCWGCVSTLTGYKWRDPSIFVANLVAAGAVLLSLYVRKMVLVCRANREASSSAEDQDITPRGFPPKSISMDNIKGHYDNEGHLM